MKTFLLGALLLGGSLSALTLETLITDALAKSPSLEMIEARLDANKQSIAVAKNFENPSLAVTKNTLSNTQAMSQTVLTLQQKIPYFSKRDSKEHIERSQEEVLHSQLYAAKAALVKEIKIASYSFWELQELRRILDEYITLTQKNIDLYESYTSVDAKGHIGIMKAELSLSELQVQKSVLDAKIQATLSRLSYLSATKVHSVEVSMELGQKPNLQTLKNSLQNNPQLRVQSKKIAKQKAKVKLAHLQNYPDVNLIAAYAVREKFDNYVNFGVSLALPIYSTEDALEERSRIEVLEQQNKKADIDLQVKAQLEAYYAQMLSAYTIYHIIEDEALPQVAHMFELSSSAISVGSDLFKYIDVLFQKLGLEQKKIQAITNYKKAQANIAELRGDLQ